MDPNKLLETVSDSMDNANISSNAIKAKKNDDLELPMKKNSLEISESQTEGDEDLNNQENNELTPDDKKELAPGDKVGSGKQISEDGEVEDSSTKKTLKAVGRGAAAYFSGGASIGQDDQIASAKPVDKVIGVVADNLEKIPGIEELSKQLDEAGLADGVNDSLDVVGKLKNGDVKGALESAKKLKKDKDKLGKKTKKIIIPIVISVVSSFLLLAVIVVAICGPVIGGFLDTVESSDEEAAEIGEIDYSYNYGDSSQEQTGIIIGSIEDFSELSDKRKAILQAAAAAVSAAVPYYYGAHPFGPGLTGIPKSGLDCAGFVQWSLWTALGTNPGYLTTQAISDSIGKNFIKISPSELKPGDIGLKRLGGSNGDNYNHTGIYAGDGYWFHASGGKKTRQVVKSKYTAFTIYLRYVGVD